MANETPLELVEYYESLLINQYNGLPNASGTIAATVAPLIVPQTSVQTITFSPAPTSGSWMFSYNGTNTASIAWNASAATIQSDLQAISGLGSVTVAGSIATALTVTFTGVIPPAYSLVVSGNSLNPYPVNISIIETDITIPLAVQNAFNLIAGTGTAVGVQLDIIGKYVGVTRSGFGFTTNITLDDTDFYTLIQMAIIKNSAQSDLNTIQNFLYEFFGNGVLYFDNQNMTVTIFISQALASQNLVQLFVTEGLLPIPMGVGYSIFYPPTANVFQFVTYQIPALAEGYPFNTYQSYNTTWHWLSYQDFIVVP